MTRKRNQSLILIALLLLAGFAAYAQASAAVGAQGSLADEGWPRRMVKDGATLLTYQPPGG